MKYRKYLFLVVFIFIIGINNVYADTCFYQIAGENSLAYDSDTGKLSIKDSDGKDVKGYQFAKKGEKLLNFNKDFNDNETIFVVGTGIVVKAMPKGTCPEAIVYRTFDNSEGVFGFANTADAATFAEASRKISRQRLFAGEEQMKVSLINRSYITQEEFDSNLIENNNKKTTTPDINPGGNYGSGNIEVSDRPMTCEEMFDQQTIDLVNDILKYPKYIVPIIIILLGTVDLFKAVIAGKEDEMKKAQRTFVKRIIIGVCVFLVPLLINFIMWLANLAGLSTCSL